MLYACFPGDRSPLEGDQLVEGVPVRQGAARDGGDHGGGDAGVLCHQGLFVHRFLERQAHNSGGGSTVVCDAALCICFPVEPRVRWVCFAEICRVLLSMIPEYRRIGANHAGWECVGYSSTRLLATTGRCCAVGRFGCMRSATKGRECCKVFVGVVSSAGAIKDTFLLNKILCCVTGFLHILRLALRHWIPSQVTFLTQCPTAFKQSGAGVSCN